jgi:hypothetical protein
MKHPLKPIPRLPVRLASNKMKAERILRPIQRIGDAAVRLLPVGLHGVVPEQLTVRLPEILDGFGRNCSQFGRTVVDFGQPPPWSHTDLTRVDMLTSLLGRFGDRSTPSPERFWNGLEIESRRYILERQGFSPEYCHRLSSRRWMKLSIAERVWLQTTLSLEEMARQESRS